MSCWQMSTVVSSQLLSADVGPDRSSSPLLTTIGSCWQLFDSCWQLCDSCWQMLDSCSKLFDSCWQQLAIDKCQRLSAVSCCQLMSDQTGPAVLCWQRLEVVDSCFTAVDSHLTAVDSCWQLLTAVSSQLLSAEVIPGLSSLGQTYLDFSSSLIH